MSSTPVRRDLRWPEEPPSLEECRYNAWVGDWCFAPQFHRYDLQSLLAYGLTEKIPEASKHAGLTWVEALQDTPHCEWWARTCPSSSFAEWFQNLKLAGFIAPEARVDECTVTKVALVRKSVKREAMGL